MVVQTSNQDEWIASKCSKCDETWIHLLGILDGYIHLICTGCKTRYRFKLDEKEVKQK